MSKIVLEFGELTLSSNELIDFTYSTSFNIQKQPTIISLELTQPGNLSPIEFTVISIIRDNCSNKFTQWHNYIRSKPLELLTFLQRVWGNYYLTDMKVSCEELDNNGDILRMRMTLTFLSNQNFE